MLLSFLSGKRVIESWENNHCCPSMSESKMWFHRINRLNISGCCLTTGPLQPATGEMCRASAGLAISLKKPPEMDRNHGKTWTGLPWVTEETEETNNRTSMRSNKLIRSINHQNIIYIYLSYVKLMYFLLKSPGMPIGSQWKGNQSCDKYWTNRRCSTMQPKQEFHDWL